MKILVVRFSSLGDIVLMTPLLRALREGFPGAEIDVVTKDTYSEVFSNGSLVNRLYTLSDGGLGGLLRLRSRLAAQRYDIIIDAHNVIRSNILVRTLRARRTIRIQKDEVKKLLLIKRKKNFFASVIHQTERYLAVVRALGVAVHDTSTLLAIPESVARSVHDAISRAGYAGRPIVALAPGTRWETKRWPERHYARLIGRLSEIGLGTVLIGGTEEAGLNGEIARESGRSPLDLTGSLSIVESAGVLKECGVLVTNDSAPLHIAEAVGTPAVALFGPTVREFGYYPRLPRSVVLETALPCRPCSRNGSAPCPLGTKECLTAIAPETVLEAVRSVLAYDGTGNGTNRTRRELTR